MYNILKNHIAYAAYDLSEVLERIRSLHARMDIDDHQRDELEAMAREHAQPMGGMNVQAKILEMDERLRKLEAAQESGGTGEAYAPYVSGKWYYAGDKCSMDGGNYTCIAPAGVVCVWSPSAYPAYWRKD